MSNLHGLNKISQINIDLDRTLLGGQAFNWDKFDGKYVGFFADRIMKIVPYKGELYWQTYPKKDDLEFARRYLDLDRDYNKILEEINKDEHIQKAIKTHSNVRVLQQDFEQTLISFIFTSHKNIKAVRKLIRDLSRTYGESIIIDGNKHYYFPTIEALSELHEKDFRKLGAGFRSKYVQQAISRLADKSLNSAIFSMLNTSSAREILVQNPGIGEKIADCILGFSLNYTDITPIDIWGKRVLTDIYKLPEKSSYRTLSHWYSSYFGINTLFAGQILFEYLRENYPHFSKNHTAH